MKTNVIFLFLFLILGAFLFFSNQYDYKKNSDKINRYKCQKVVFSPFPPGYDYPKYTTIYNYKNQDNRFKNNILNLERLNLKALPDDIFADCSQCITDLDLSENNMVQIPNAIRFLENLRILNMSESGLTSMDASKDLDKALGNLDYLYLQNNEIEVLNYLPTSQKKILEVNLENNKISKVELPKNASNSIKKLNLSYNNLAVFPMDLLQIYGLTTLSLSKNNIHLLPTLNKGQLTSSNIHDLDLTDNRISRFPSEFGHLKELRVLELQGNQISGTIELNNNSFPNLKELSLTSQHVDSVIIKRTAIPKVTQLNLFGNNIVSFKAEKNNTQSFEVLSLENNNLTSFPSDVQHLKYLKHLNLSGNQIKGKVLIADSNLEFLDLSNNQITEIHFSGKNNIKELILNDNQLTTITCDKGALPYLKVKGMKLDGNPNLSITGKLLNEIPKLLDKTLVEDLEVKYNNNDFLDFSDNNLKTIRFSGSNKVKHLNLEDNQLVSFSFNKGSLQDLEILDMSYNPFLKEFPFNIFDEAPNLKKVDVIGCTGLSKNQIDKLVKISKRYGVKCVLDWRK